MSSTFLLHIESTTAAPAGEAGAPEYEIVRGFFSSELDPDDPRNQLITDLQYAPRNDNGRVDYSATFAIAKPVDMRHASGVLIYDVPNRGMHLDTLAAHREGHVRVVSGWQSDLQAAPGMYTATAPLARQPSGEPVISSAFARFVDIPADTHIRLSGTGHTRHPRGPAFLSGEARFRSDRNRGRGLGLF
jgi:hypothetical protein